MSRPYSNERAASLSWTLDADLDQCSRSATYLEFLPQDGYLNPSKAYATAVQPAEIGYPGEMAQTVEEIMTRDPRTVDSGDTIVDAARVMRDADIGDVVVMEDGQVSGIITDRDIVVRAVAEGRDADSTSVGDVCTTGVETVDPSASVDDALRIMREHDIRRLPVAKSGRPVGIISLGDLAVEREPDSTLADISAASPDQ